MFILKWVLLLGVFVCISAIGLNIAKRYKNRADNLKQIKKALNIFETKISYTYEPIPDVFLEISRKIKGGVGNLFENARKNMEFDFAGDAWEKSVDQTDLILTNDDKEALKSLGKLLGSTDIDGQISQINLVNNFLDFQINEANENKSKNEIMYKKLGVIIGLAVVIVIC